MRIIQSTNEMQTHALALKRQGNRLGLVPTMGCLHEGHLSLVKLARAQADIVILSLFVNPTQFGPNEDFDRYPRSFTNDVRLCQNAGVDVLFAPESTGMYNHDHSVFVEETTLGAGLCGASRPGHFRGVLTVVAKLFNLCRPDVAIFGQKDAQQAILIKRMARDLNFPASVIIAPIIREPDGLAMSSRNAYLLPEERIQATALYRGLQAAKDLFDKGEYRAAVLMDTVRKTIEESKMIRVDYLVAVDAASLKPADTILQPTLLALAVFIGATRLIDNIVLEPIRNRD